MRLLPIIIAATLSAPLLASPAVARDYPFCALGGKTTEAMQCDYATLAQCQAATAGSGGSCIANPSGSAAARAPATGAPAKR